MKNKNTKKQLIIRGSILFFIGIVSLTCVIYYNFIKNDSNPFKDSNKISDAIRFKQEYESLNNVTDTDGNLEYINLEINKNNPIVYKNSKEIIDILQNGTGIIYFGFNKCPWCRNAIPSLIDAAIYKNVKKIYYLDILDIRNQLVLENGKIITKKEGTSDYLKLLEILDEHLSIYDGLEDDTIKRIYAPTVVFIRDGEFVGLHEGTVESHTNAKETLNKEQYNELKNIYIDLINKVYENDTCISQDNC